MLDKLEETSSSCNAVWIPRDPLRGRSRSQRFSLSSTSAKYFLHSSSPPDIAAYAAVRHSSISSRRMAADVDDRTPFNRTTPSSLRVRADMAIDGLFFSCFFFFFDIFFVRSSSSPTEACISEASSSPRCTSASIWWLSKLPVKSGVDVDRTSDDDEIVDDRGTTITDGVCSAITTCDAVVRRAAQFIQLGGRAILRCFSSSAVCSYSNKIKALNGSGVAALLLYFLLSARGSVSNSKIRRSI